VNNHQKTVFVRVPDQDKPVFFLGMQGIINGQGQGISKGRARELIDFLPWQWARVTRLTGQKGRSNDWFAPQSGAGQSGGLTQSGNSRVRTAKRCERFA
jgi:hypothetical protein